MASSGNLPLPDDPRHIERVWWNGIDARADGCAFVALGCVPGERGWFVRRSDNERWTRFDRRQDALAVARLMTRGWTPVIVAEQVQQVAA
jgi:hypothetical protein